MDEQRNTAGKWSKSTVRGILETQSTRDGSTGTGSTFAK
jgi:hypothetical protein